VGLPPNEFGRCSWRPVCGRR